MMADKERGVDELVQRLMDETGISQEEAEALINVLGANWPSLVFEARLMRREQAREAPG